jgi:methylmalonyl-CoA mutase
VYKATAAAFGGTQSLHTNALDETLAQQTFQTEIARNANIFEETKITKL